MTSPHASPRVGVFGIGLESYWHQFPGLRERLAGYLARIESSLSGAGRKLFREGWSIRGKGRRRRPAVCHRRRIPHIPLHFDLRPFLHRTPVVQKARVPVIVLNLQPAGAIDYAWFNALGDRGTMTGEWLASARHVPYRRSRMSSSGPPFHSIR